MSFLNQMFGIKPRGVRRVHLVQRSGVVDDKAYARECPGLGGWIIYEATGILSALGKDGTFPHGNPWGWIEWGFADETKRPPAT